MFGKSSVSKSVIDAVNSVLGEEPVEENKKPSMLSEKEDISPETLRGKILKQKDDKKAELGKSAVAMSVEETIAQKNAILLRPDVSKEQDSTFINAVTKAIYGERNVQIESAKESKKRMLADDELDETGFHMAAHAAKKSGASQFEFQGKKYPVTAKSHTEEYELDEEGNCVTPAKVKKIADKEVGKHVDKMHDKEKDLVKKESISFKDRLLERSVSTKQARTMAGVAHNPEFAKKMGIPQSVGKEFNKADKGTKMLSKAMKGEEVELDEKDELRDRIGTNIVNKKPREGQTDLRNIPAGNRPDGKNKFSQGERDSQPTRLKNSIKASLGKHSKPNLPEEMEVTESLKDVAKKILSKVGGGSDKDQLKRLQKNMGVPQTGEKPMKKEEYELTEEDKHVKMAMGILNDKRYKGGNLKGAVNAIEKMKPGLSKHPAVQKAMQRANEEVELDETENPFTSYKDKTKPSIMAPKSHTAKKTEKGTMYTKNWSKKDMEHKDDKPKNEAVEDKEHKQHVRIAGETDMNTKTVDGLRGRMKVPADYHNKSRSYKVALNVEEAEHDDEKEDKALVKKMVKKDALKKTDEAFKGPEAGSGVGDHPFVTSEAKPLKNARELAKKTMHRIKNEMLGKISN